MQIKDYADTRQCLVCLGTMKRVFTPFAIHGFGFDIGYKGYNHLANDPEQEDMDIPWEPKL